MLSASFEFLRFIQILVWIVLPVFLLAISLTIFFHYRRKKKAITSIVDDENEFVLAVPEQFSHKITDGEYVFFDHSGLIREYKSRMFYSDARFRALRNDYAALEARYTSLSLKKPTLLPPKNNKDIYMKNHNDEMLTVDDNAIEKRELSDKLEQLTKSYQRLEEENRFLQEQISLETAGDDEKDKIVTRWKDENKKLREKISEQEYLEEVLEEKKAQIVFLQQQLEHRIRNQHQADQQRQQATLDMTEALEQHQAILSQVESLKSDVKTKQDHIIYMENVLNEIKEQNALLNAEAADERDEKNALKQLLNDERSHQQHLESKLQNNKQLLQKLFKDVGAILNESPESPIIPMRTSYIRDETAIH